MTASNDNVNVDWKSRSAKLAMMQQNTLSAKIKMTERRVIEFYERCGGMVYVSFSGGKDSTVLAHIARSLYPEIPLVFSDTGLEYPEIREFVKTFSNVTIVKPAMSFSKVIREYGYPVVSKRNSEKIYNLRNTKTDAFRERLLNGTGMERLPQKWRFLVNAPFKISDKCCDVMKKRPLAKYNKETGRWPIIGTMAEESMLRKQTWIRDGCNSFRPKKNISAPMAFWRTSDVWEYIHNFNVPYCSIYDTGITRTGCMFCMFGIQNDQDGENRFQLMKSTHPKLYKYCIEKLGCGRVLDFLGIDY